MHPIIAQRQWNRVFHQNYLSSKSQQESFRKCIDGSSTPHDYQTRFTRTNIHGCTFNMKRTGISKIVYSCFPVVYLAAHSHQAQQETHVGKEAWALYGDGLQELLAKETPALVVQNRALDETDVCRNHGAPSYYEVYRKVIQHENAHACTQTRGQIHMHMHTHTRAHTDIYRQRHIYTHRHTKFRSVSLT